MCRTFEQQVCIRNIRQHKSLSANFAPAGIRSSEEHKSGPAPFYLRTLSLYGQVQQFRLFQQKLIAHLHRF